MTRIEFFVHGKPQPQGSSSAFVIAGRAHVTSANKKLKPWRQQVTAAARVALFLAGYDGDEGDEGDRSPMFKKHVPVCLTAVFTFTKPKSAKKREFMVVTPDCDKLVRGIGDALTKIVYEDDAQLVEIRASKVYGPIEGCGITVESAEDVMSAVQKRGE